MSTTYLEDDYAVLRALCAALKRWGMRINAYSSGDDAPAPEEARKAAPYVPEEQAMRLALGYGAVLLFDSEAECYAAYDDTVGDDGPTTTNPYTGPVRVGAVTCSPAGELQSENT